MSCGTNPTITEINELIQDAGELIEAGVTAIAVISAVVIAIQQKNFLALASLPIFDSLGGLQSKIGETIDLSGNALAEKISEIKQEFGEAVDIDGILADIDEVGDNICSVVPNFQIIGDVIQLLPPASLVPAGPAQAEQFKPDMTEGLV